MAQRAKDSSTTIVPISNIPNYGSDESRHDDNDGVPSKRDFVIYRLKRKISDLQETQRELLDKLTFALHTLIDQKQFFEKGLHYGQWETYDEITRRRLHILATIDALTDPMASPKRITLPLEEEAARQREKGKL